MCYTLTLKEGRLGDYDLMKIPSEYVGRSTWEKVLNHIALSEEPSPYLLIDKDIIRDKVSLIGKNIKTQRCFMPLRQILI